MLKRGIRMLSTLDLLAEVLRRQEPVGASQPRTAKALSMLGSRRSIMRSAMTKLLHVGTPVMCAMLVLTLSPARAQQPAPFHLQEATIAGIHSAFAAGRLTCAQLTRAYLDRIEAYNLKGPALRAIITVNPRAMESLPRRTGSTRQIRPASARCTASRSSSRTISTPLTCRRRPAMLV